MRGVTSTARGRARWRRRLAPYGGLTSTATLRSRSRLRSALMRGRSQTATRARRAWPATHRSVTTRTQRRW